MATTKVDIGYPAVAHVMATPGLTMFKCFAALNAKNLLYMQGEILVLERQLDVLGDLDHGDDGDEDTKKYATSCEALMKSDDSQWEKILELRGKLEAYSQMTPGLRPTLIPKD